MILENLRKALNEQKLPPRPAQFEALAIWELMAIRQRQQKFERRMRKAEKTLAEARWDSEHRMWRREIIDGVRKFLAITQEADTQGRKATCKTDKGSSKEKETKRSWADADDSDDDEFLNQLLHDRPPPYAMDDNRPSTSAGPVKSTQDQGTANAAQVNTVATSAPVQNSACVSTAPEMQTQLQPPLVQRLYPDVPILETTTSLMVPPDQAYTRPKCHETLRFGTADSADLKCKRAATISNAGWDLSLQGLTAQQLNEWLDKLNSPQTTPVTTERSEREKYLNFVRLGMEAAELVEGSMGVNRLESYNEAELRYLCPKITKEVSKVHQRLANLADKYGIDLDNTKHLKRSYRLDFEPKDFDHMRSTGMKAHLKEILQRAQVWGALEKWEGRWTKKRDKRKSDCSEQQQTKSVPDTGTMKAYPMRETAGGVLVPWSRGDILSFTNDFPRFREKPIEWYQQTDRFVKLAKCLWEDLNTLFEIIVPADLWIECKRSVDWPTAELARDRATGAPSPDVMRYYYKVIEFLKQKVSPQNIDWQKEAKESIHAYYERLLKAFKHYSGTEVIKAKDMNHLVFRFVEGLRPEISQMIKNHLICWQAKPVDEVLQYAKYCSDEIELKQRKLKEKVMMMQIKAAQAGMQLNGVQQMVQQPQGKGMFPTQVRGKVEEGLRTVV
ncbi:hypothetical protein NDU88_003905 [Pleurodeles waltl]|uniref:Uncharacterized protein n=1 Tax=Pleurodeles waltl TaxID=8319 RepID=A0AAV7QDZ2_PLEWA|nr:hypothetical protein NDU88_003905 [Pleurodeles waltl]